MAQLHSFYLPPEQWQPPYTLTGTEAHHLSRVLRMKLGSEVRLFDGEGRHGLFLTHKITKSSVEFTCKEEFFTERHVTRHTVAAGFSKALRRGWFLEKAVELEAHELIFWQADYSQASIPDKEKAAWKASLISGAKQCHNAWLPKLTMLPDGIDALIAMRSNYTNAYLLYEGDTKGRVIRKNELAVEGDTLMVIGPEGGFSPREVTLLIGAEFTPVSLGNRVLRWETAAIVTLGLAWWAKQ